MTDRFTSELFSPGLTNWSGYTKMPWRPGDNLRLRVELDADDPSGVDVRLHTNANNNGHIGDFYDLPMAKVGQWNHHLAFEANVPIRNLGAYRFAAFSTHRDGSQHWMGEDGMRDAVIRPFAREFNDLNIEEVQVDQANDGSFEAMTTGGPSEYTLEHLAASGINALWLMPPFETKPWSGRHPHDDKGSPYAVTDYFSVKRELSRDARELVAAGRDDKTGGPSRDAANAEFRRFVEKAHALGIKVFLDVALNHFGHNYDFRDRFVDRSNGSASIHFNDFSQVALNPEHRRIIEARLRDPNIPKYLEYLDTAFYAKKPNKDGSIDRRGAQSLNDTIAGGWGDWQDTKQLNHGGHWGNGHAETPENAAVLGWYTRMLTFWAADMGVDGFRFDHTTGLPPEVLEVCFNAVQAEVDRAQPGKHLYYLAEDFHHVDRTRKFVDNIQGGFYRAMIAARRTSDFRSTIDHDYFQETKNGGSHDEVRLENAFGGNVQAVTRFHVLMQLFGGPSCRLMGDDYVEGARLDFRAWAKVPTLMQLRSRSIADANAQAHETIAQAGRIKLAIPALQTDDRSWLQRTDGYTDETLLAFARHPESSDAPDVLVFANLEDDKSRHAQFSLDARTRARIDPSKNYNVRDIMRRGHENEHLWRTPKSGRELLESGIFARLGAYQVQALVLEEAT
ncbi:MAG: hypothetical protein IPK13_07195 [Deltaproteobacteria bacterium]|nr:hypothetical protein [Deltaproteobacteria bacterium]